MLGSMRMSFSGKPPRVSWPNNKKVVLTVRCSTTHRKGMCPKPTEMPVLKKLSFAWLVAVGGGFNRRRKSSPRSSSCIRGFQTTEI